MEINPKLDYNTLKNEVRCLFGVEDDEEKVIKLRNKDFILIPLMNLLEGNSPEKYAFKILYFNLCFAMNILPTISS